MVFGGPLGRTVKRIVVTIVGATITLIGIALLVLPGPGLLMVLLGLIVLSTQFPAVRGVVDPVRRRAMAAAEQSVSSPLRIAGSVLAGLGLVGAGVVWGLNPTLPFGGWPTGASLVLSGMILLSLLIYSYRRVQAQRDSEAGSARAAVPPATPLSSRRP